MTELLFTYLQNLSQINLSGSFHFVRTGMRNKWENKVFDPINGSIYYKNTMVACELGGNSHPPDITFFDLSTIVVATNSFSPTNKLGQGGFGSVYRVKSLCNFWILVVLSVAFT